MAGLGLVGKDRAGLGCVVWVRAGLDRTVVCRLKLYSFLTYISYDNICKQSLYTLSTCINDKKMIVEETNKLVCLISKLNRHHDFFY